MRLLILVNGLRGRVRQSLLSQSVKNRCEFSLFFFCHTTGHAELPLPGIEPVPPAMEVQSPNQGTIKKSYVWVLCKLSSAVITGKAPGGGTSFSLDDTVTLWSRACLPHPLYPPLVWKHEWEISICCVNPLRFQSLSVTATYVKYFLEQDIYW